MVNAIVSSRVRLSRDYDDLTFKTDAAEAQTVNDRVLKAIRKTDEEWRYLLIRSLETEKKNALRERHTISKEAVESEWSALLLHMDGAASILLNGTDHVRIQVDKPGFQLSEAADEAFALDNQIQTTNKFAFDARLGFLTASPADVGTGFRASFLVHLPIHTVLKQTGSLPQIAAKAGLSMRNAYSEDNRLLGGLFVLSSQTTLGREETQTIDLLKSVAQQISHTEAALQKKAFEKPDQPVHDMVFRAYGLLRYARRMSFREFMMHWSGLRLGVSAGLLPVPLETVDKLLYLAQPAHLQEQAEKALQPAETDIARAELIRRVLS